MKLRQFCFLVVISISAYGVYSCKNRSGSSSRTTAANTPERAHWLTKLVLLVRSGESLKPGELEKYSGKSDDEVLDELTSSSDFQMMTLMFNNYFLGQSFGQMYSQRSSPLGTRVDFSDDVYAWPQSIQSAREVASNGDYFKLFAKEPPFYMLSPQMPLTVTKQQFEAFKSDDLKGFDMNGPGATRVSLCLAVKNLNSRIMSTVGQRASYGMDSRVVDFIKDVWMTPLVGTPDVGAPGQCDRVKIPDQEIVTKVNGLVAFLTQFWNFENLNNAHPGPPKTLAELNQYDVTNPGAFYIWPKSLWSQNIATVSNSNRKRAAFLLKTYMCDDLTPVVLPANQSPNAIDAHGSLPACKSCHYKLDPIGALFRFHGYKGNNYSGSDISYFDVAGGSKQAVPDPDFKKYLSQWDKDGLVNAGYFTSPGNRHPNWRGSDLGDFWDFLPQSEQAKSCVVQRLADFVLGPEQVYDREWLDQISKDFKPGPGSGQEFKKVFKSLAVSKTFKTVSPNYGTCYDFVEQDGAGGQDRAPCEVASIFAGCSGCHYSTDYQVDFSKWVMQSDGRRGFTHLDANGTPLPRSTSYALIFGRITADDPEVRMPQGGTLSEMQKQILQNWFQKDANP